MILTTLNSVSGMLTHIAMDVIVARNYAESYTASHAMIIEPASGVSDSAWRQTVKSAFWNKRTGSKIAKNGPIWTI